MVISGRILLPQIRDQISAGYDMNHPERKLLVLTVVSSMGGQVLMSGNLYAVLAVEHICMGHGNGGVLPKVNFIYVFIYPLFPPSSIVEASLLYIFYLCFMVKIITCMYVHIYVFLNLLGYSI